MTLTKSFTDTAKYSILCSSRIRLNDEERAALKTAYQKLRAGHKPANRPSVNGSSISVDTQFTVPQLDQALGMNSYTFSDLISSRDSINLPMLIKLQKVLGVTVVDRERLLEAHTSYVDHVLSNV